MMLRGSYRKHQCLLKVILEESDLVTPQNDLKEIVADGNTVCLSVRDKLKVLIQGNQWL